MLVNDDIHALSMAVSGIVAVPDSPEFAEETFAFNVATVHRPDVVLGAADAQDVAAGVKWAAERRLPVSVQSTGHGTESAVDGGLLINTRRLQEVQIDPVERTAQVGAGVKWRSVLEASVPHGLIGLHGSSTDVGVVGYTLGGGLPVLGHAHGFAADHVRSMEVVTADGALRRIDAEAELFALMCGGKGNFGIVTALEFSLFPLGEFYGGGIIYPGADAAPVLAAFRAWLPTLPDAASPSISLLRLPDMDFVPAPLRGQFVVHLRLAFLGNREEGDALLAPMRAVSTPLMDTAGPMNYLDVDQIHMDPVDPLPFTDGGALLKEFGEEAVGELLRLAGDGTDCPLLMIEIRPLGGALSRGGVLPDAVSGRDAAFLLFLLGFKLPPVLPAVTESIRAILAAMAPYSTGYTLVNFHGEPGDEADRARAWSPAVYERMRAAKSSYDPGNLLRFGHAITGVPAAG
ncbi:FAD/FMN-containing dehydrogenase [Arthrobacter sp. V4I6]|uniref:FAD-binding oxidoreductase n=1 Tax=unclassified Arthrobacter TaxID=235627 RepID=UPI002782D786|nr:MULTISPECIES: FAD-binding oxidoreductase [unclassified Arthrobacter]MDQ0822771.1 FAD/FMN-containing dehydrogenase [Arthrobacter sp. V1I7]MDQ0852399.1 FAD/FMN-containing dehydrogenase [Arthrobacter sp. V4I6]